MWDHVVKCKETINLRKEFKEDILVYLENDHEDQYKTNLKNIGIIELFHEHTVNDWMESNLNAKKCRYLNMIAVRESVYFYD